jgi:N-acetylmuramoyl-L-alanine amidase
MPSEKLVHPPFGILAISLSLFLSAKENTALAVPTRPHPYVVVVDPGHGGTDTGTSGREGKLRISEKELSLAIALRLQKLLQSSSYWRPLGRPVKVVLTRKRDEYVTLEKRSEQARRNKADLFISVHANSDPARQAAGLETYFLNNTDEESSLKLQEIENRTSLRRRKQTAHHEQDLLLRSIAADAEVDVSRTAAEVVHGSLVDHLRSEQLSFQDRGVRQAMLYVLLDSQVPAILVECFFLSSKSDLAIVGQAENRERIAEGLARGILRFLAQK